MQVGRSVGWQVGRLVVGYCIILYYVILYYIIFHYIYRKSTPQLSPSSHSQVHTAVLRKNMQNLHVHQKSPIACFGQKITPALLRCAHSQKNNFLNFLNFQMPKNVFWGLGTFWHVQKIIDSFTILKMFHKLALIHDKS